MELSTQAFLNQKNQILISADLSRKGSIDEPIEDLIMYLNNLNDFVTTSSCSGRLVILNSSSDESNCKKGCKWQFVSHTIMPDEEVLTTIKEHLNSANLLLKFEPFILHVQCRNINSAKKLQNCAFGAGFRNSGVMLGRHGKVTVAVRGCHSLEVPLSDEQELLVSEQYLRFLIKKCNKKFLLNEDRTKRFFIELKTRIKNVDDKTLVL